jgi:hypothetical protein
MRQKCPEGQTCCRIYFRINREFRVKGIPLTFSLRAKGKVKGTSFKKFVRVKGTLTDRDSFPWADSPGNDKHTSKNKIPQK